MSHLPSPSTSPVPATAHGLAAVPGEPPPITDVPFNSQTTACPVLLLYQRISVIPSPLKSPVPSMAQGLPTEPSEPPPVTEVPFVSQITTCPAVLLYQRTSTK